MTPLVNAVFLIRNIGGTFYQEFTSDLNGEVNLTALPPGAYQVLEIRAPEGYLIDNAVRTFQINPDEHAMLVFTNTRKPVLEIVKWDGQNYLPGATFKITRIADVSHHLDRITDINGRIRIEGLEPGIYAVQEIAPPPGFVLNDRIFNVELFPGQTSQLVMVNERKPDLKIIKTDVQTGVPVPGTTFTVRKVDSATLTTVTTGPNGEVLLTEMDPGVYQIIEQSVPFPYILDTRPQLITLVPNSLGTVQFQNAAKPTLTIRKIDSFTNLPLPNARFQIWHAEHGSLTGSLRHVGMFYSDANGLIVLPHVDVGWYRIVEEEPPSGYGLKAPSTQDVFMEPGQDRTLTFENIPLSALVIRKINNVTGLPVPGASFRVRYLGGTSGTGGTIIHEGVTSLNGTIVLTGLAAGTYVVEEWRAAPGFEISNPSVQTAILTGLDQDVVELVFTNAAMGHLVIQKLCSVTAQPLRGATFRVADSGGAVIGPNNGEYVTDAGGLIHITEFLPIGSTVVVQELRAPDGFILDTNAQTVLIRENTTHTLTFHNTPLGGLLIRKFDAVTGQPVHGAVFRVTDSGGAVVGTSGGEFTTGADGTILIPRLLGTFIAVEVRAPEGYLLNPTPQTIHIPDNRLYTLTFYNDPQPGLQILKLDDETRRPIPGVEFLVSEMNGRVLGTFRTDSQGLITIPGIHPGWFTAIETRAAQGYLLDTTPHNIEVTPGRMAVLTVTNRRSSSILIRKICSVSRQGIQGVTFLLYDAGNRPIGQFMSDQNGHVFINEGLSHGMYRIRELNPAPGYAPDGTVRTIWLEYGRTTEIIWENVPMMGQIMVTKRSMHYNELTGLPAGSPLAGAAFEVFATNGNMVDRMVSDARGVAASRPLPLGVYFVREVTPPRFYALNSRDFFAELRHHGDIVRFEALNENVSLGLTIQKRSQAQATPGQTILYELYNIANTSSTALDNFYVNDRLPTDAVRGWTVWTGTWSHRLTYRVTYRTNFHTEYRVLASGLSTRTNQELSIHPNVLGLRNGEYVTNVRWEFGTVPAGFRSETNPMLRVQVLPTLPSGYRIINRAEAGGMYLGEWETAQANWITTIVWGHTPPELPRAGH
jgi:uncharacterized surface anchored protein